MAFSTNVQKSRGGIAPRRAFLTCLGRFQIDGLATPRIRLDVEGDALTFIQAAHASHLHGCGVNEHVLAAAFRRDESKAFAGVEKLYGSDRHVFS
jgi:hypothetical protein